jgi:hypothetical protein
MIVEAEFVKVKIRVFITELIALMMRGSFVAARKEGVSKRGLELEWECY